MYHPRFVYFQNLAHDFNSQRLVLHAHLRKAAPKLNEQTSVLFTVSVSHRVTRAAYQGISALAGRAAMLVFSIPWRGEAACQFIDLAPLRSEYSRTTAPLQPKLIESFV